MSMPLKLVDNYNQLPNEKNVKQFLDYLAKKAEVKDFDDVASWFFVASSLKEAYLILSLSFGEPSIADVLRQMQVPQTTCKSVQQKLSSQAYSWNQKLPPFKMFQQNVKQLGREYPFFQKQVFSLLNESQAKQIFDQVKESIYLFGVKIRVWPRNDGRYTSLKRLNEDMEVEKLNGANYLLIADGDDKSFLVGFIHEQSQIQSSRNSFADINNFIYKPQYLKSNKSLTIARQNTTITAQNYSSFKSNPDGKVGITEERVEKINIVSKNNQTSKLNKPVETRKSKSMDSQDLKPIQPNIRSNSFNFQKSPPNSQDSYLRSKNVDKQGPVNCFGSFKNCCLI